MKITIRTHKASNEEVKKLNEYLLNGGWDFKVDENEGIYFQPLLSDAEWNEYRDFNSFDVYHSFQNAKADFPNNEIGAYSGDDIEEPTFID